MLSRLLHIRHYLHSFLLLPFPPFSPYSTAATQLRPASSWTCVGAQGTGECCAMPPTSGPEEGQRKQAALSSSDARGGVELSNHVALAPFAYAAGAPSTPLAAQPVVTRAAVLRLGNTPRPRGRAPVTRDERGRSLGVTCVWNGLRWVAPGPCITTTAATAATSLVGPATERNGGHDLQVVASPHTGASAPRLSALDALLSQLGYASRSVEFRMEVAVHAVPASVQVIQSRLATQPSWHGAFPDNPKLAQHGKVEAAMEEMGLAALLRPDESPIWGTTPDPFEVKLEASLRAKARARIAQSTEPESLLTALGWYRIHHAAFPNIVPFRPLSGGVGDMAISAANECTIVRIGELMRLYGSRRPGEQGKTLKASTISAVQSTLRGLCTREAGHELELRGGHQRTKRQLKDMRRQDGPRAAVRAKRHGFKAQHFEQAVRAGLERLSRGGVRRFAVMHFCHNAVARGGSAGVSKSSDVFDPGRGLTCTDIVPDLAKRGLLGLIAYVFPGKDCNRQHVKRPIPVSSRPAGTWDGEGDDPRDAYKATMAEYALMLVEVPIHLRATTPFFRKLGTLEPITTADVAGFVGDARVACGEQRECHELAHELRIGGASNLYDEYGIAGKQILIDRGRWKDDIAFIYARTSAESQYEASARMGNAMTRTLESLSELTQPA